MRHDLGSLVEIIAFLVAITVLAKACAAERLFEALGGRVARLARGSGTRLLTWSVVLAALVTSVLSLDATVVLLTPVLIAASTVGRQRAYAYATVRLANSASTLLPVSNLTNLLVFASTGLSFIGFTWAMLPVWLVAIAAEQIVLRVWFRAELREPQATPTGEPETLPRFPLAIVIVVLVALGAGATPWVPAAIGAMLVGGYALVRRSATWTDLLRAANLPMAAAVLAWASLVLWIGTTRVGDWFAEAMPSHTSLGAMILTALIAMVVANIVNNLPATLLLLPAAAAAGPEAVLALLVGVNIGANLTIIGSLANILWRQSGGRMVSSLREFHLLGILTTPAIVVLCTTVLWAWTSLIW